MKPTTSASILNILVAAPNILRVLLLAVGIGLVITAIVLLLTGCNTTSPATVVFVAPPLLKPRLQLRAAPSPQSSVPFVWDSVPDAAGYKIYQGVSSRDYTNAIITANTFGRAPYFGQVTNYYAATAYSTNGIESDYTLEVVIAPPLPVYDLLYIQASTNLTDFFDLTSVPYMRITNGAGAASLQYRSRAERTTDWR